MTGFPDFYSYCNRCSHQKVCEYFKLLQCLDRDLNKITSDIKDRWEIETGEDVNFYGLICLPQPCPKRNEGYFEGFVKT